MSVRQTDVEISSSLLKRRAGRGAALLGLSGLFLLGALLLDVPAADAITVGPAKLEYRADPGMKLEGKMFIMNDSAQPQTFYPSFEKFTEVEGEKKFVAGEPTELANWFKMPRQITLGPGEQKDIPFVIEVPENAPPGGHFAVVWWGNAPAGGGQVSIVTRAGVLVYLRVSGDVRENGEVVSFTSLAGRVAARLPDFGVRFRNGGNTYLKPAGEVRVKNMFGGITAVFKVNDVGRIILPGGEENLRLSPRFDRRPFALGLYRAELDLSWGEKPETFLGRYYFLVLPWLHLLLGLIVILALYLAAKIGLRKYNQRIIAKYTASLKK